MIAVAHPHLGRLRRVALALALGSSATVLSCCNPAKRAFRAETESSVEAGVVVALDVPGDVKASLVRTTSKSKRVVVYLPPKCVDGTASFRGWAVDAAADVSAIGLAGDQPCVGTPHMQLSGDVHKLVARVDAALAAAAAAISIDKNDLVLAGYSQGAARAEDLAQAFPARFTRVMMIGSPEAPQVSHLGHAKAVATLAGEKDRRDLMLVGTQALERAGTPAKFFMLPAAAHGEMGPDGGRVMREAFAWLWQTAP